MRKTHTAQNLRISLPCGLLLVFTACFGIVHAQTSAKLAAKPSPELVDQLTKQLSITPAQATGGAGALFGIAKSRLSVADFSKIAAAVPGMNGFLKAAPPTTSPTAAHFPGVSSLSGALPGGASGLASAAQSFQKLGLNPDMVGRFVPVLTGFVESKGGAGAASLFSGIFR